jgi:hypothetical protein
MMGFQKIEKEYFDPIRFIFHEPNIMVGAMGGRPGQALYFVGIQNNELLFLDPHLVQEAVTYQEEEWVDCEFSKDDFAEFTQQSMKEKKSKKFAKKLRKGAFPMRKNRANAIHEKESGPVFPKVKIRDADR